VIAKIELPELLDVLDRILDKGIVVDVWMRFSLAGIDFLTVEARMVVASIETYLEYAAPLRLMRPASPPRPRLEIVTSRFTPRSSA